MKNTFLKIFILVAVFIGVCAGALFFSLRRDEKPIELKDKDIAQFPIVSFAYQGYTVNALTGYTGVQAGNAFTVRDVLLPLQEQRKVSLRVLQRGSAVTGIRYMVYDAAGERLYEENTVDSFVKNGAYLNAEFSLTNLLQENTECQLHIYITLESGEEVFYSTRAVYIINSYLEGFLEMSSSVSEALLAKDTIYLQQYVSFTGEKGTTDLHYVNLQSSVRQATWAGLTPVLTGSRTLRIYDITETQAAFSWVYEVRSAENNAETFYDVEEYFSMRMRSEKYYVLDYERWTQEQFSGTAANMGTTSILLGIQQKNNVSMIKDAAGKKIAFIVDGGIQYYNYSNNEMTEVFSFDDTGIPGHFRNQLYQMKLLQMDEKGNLYFAVWGYMPSGIHEGECGLTLYRYIQENNVTEEIAYVSSIANYETVKEQCGHVLYMNQEGLCYFDFGGRLYSIDRHSLECQEVTAVIGNQVCVSQDGTHIAWKDAIDDNVIHLLDMEQNEMIKLEGKGAYVTALGFIEEDFVYGIRAEHISRSKLLGDVQLLESVHIVNMELEEQAVYQKEGVLIRQVVLENYSVVLQRVKMKAPGLYEMLSEDVLTLSQHAQDTAAVDLKVASSNMKYNYYYITFGRAVPTSPLFSSKVCRYSAALPKNLGLQAGAVKTKAAYTAYYAGRLTAKTNVLSEAVQGVFDGMGVVLQDGKVIWDRDSRSLYVTLSMPALETVLEQVQSSSSDVLKQSLEAALVTIQLLAGQQATENGIDIYEALSDENSAFSIMQQMFGEKTVDLTGCTTAQVLYYINQRHPVLAVTGEGQAVLIYGYNSGNIHVYDPLTGTSWSLATDGEADEYFAPAGFLFMSYVD